MRRSTPSRKMAAEAEALKSMVLTFRVSELQMLLGFAGRNKSGRKTELQARAVDLLKLRSLPIQMKIKDLYKQIQQGLSPGLSAQESMPSPPLKDIPMAHNNSTQQQQMQQRSGVVYNPSAGYNHSVHNPASRMYPHSGVMYHQNPYTTSKPIQQPSSYPVHPDVRLKKLPFSEIIGELIKPSTLVPQATQRPQETSFVFHLTPQQATQVATGRDTRPGSKIDYLYQVQLRFCLLETSCDQDDCFPPGAVVKVNSKVVQLPNPIPTNKQGVEPKRPPRPVHISPYVKLSPTVANHVAISWTAEFGRGYAVAIYLVKKLTSTDLLQQLTKKGPRQADITRGLIKEKLNEDADCEIATTSLRVSLACPLGKMRMAMPCRATTCNHLQCFDASLYLQMNEKKPSWNCPVCDKPALFDNLVIDGYFQQVLSSGQLTSDGNEVQLHQDGTWTPMYIKKESADLCVTPITPMRATSRIETIGIDDSDEFPTPTKEEPKKPASPAKSATVIDLTLSDSDDEMGVVAAAPKKTVPAIKPDSSNRQSDSTTSVSSTSSGSATAGGSVSSSGYMSPSVITLDSPSPPVTPVPQDPPVMRPPTFFPMSFLDLDSDSNGSNPVPLYRFQ